MSGRIGEIAPADVCPFCGEQMAVQLVPETMSYVTPTGDVQLSVEMPYMTCEACGFRGFGEAGERARTEAIYRHHNRVPPWEIAGIRERLNMSQKAFAEFIGVGHASVERWESGATMQNQSMDNLILLLSDPANKVWLERERRRREVQLLRVQSVVRLDRFRALTQTESAELQEVAKKFRLRR